MKIRFLILSIWGVTLGFSYQAGAGDEVVTEKEEKTPAQRPAGRPTSASGGIDFCCYSRWNWNCCGISCSY